MSFITCPSDALGAIYSRLRQKLTSLSNYNRPADAQREDERESVFDILEKDECRALVALNDTSVQAVCPNFGKTFGLGHKEMMGRRFATILGPDPDMNSWESILQTTNVGQMKETTIKTFNMNGSSMNTKVHAMPWCTDRGQVTHIMLTLTKLTSECSPSCMCFANFRTADMVRALLQVTTDSKGPGQIRRSATRALKFLASEDEGISIMKCQRVFPILAKMVSSKVSLPHDLASQALGVLSEVASRKPLSFGTDSTGPILSLAFDVDNDGKQTQLKALEIVLSLSWEQQSVDMMASSDYDVIFMLTVVQQRMVQSGHDQHAAVAASALSAIRIACPTHGSTNLPREQSLLAKVLREEALWGVDESMRAGALAVSLANTRKQTSFVRRGRNRTLSINAGDGMHASPGPMTLPGDEPVGSMRRLSALFFEGQSPLDLHKEKVLPSIANSASEVGWTTRETNARESAQRTREKRESRRALERAEQSKQNRLSATNVKPKQEIATPPGPVS